MLQNHVTSLIYISNITTLKQLSCWALLLIKQFINISKVVTIFFILIKRYKSSLIFVKMSKYYHFKVALPTFSYRICLPTRLSLSLI